jgi:radical SAM-linked protein
VRLRYSQGFHPKPDLSFGPALSLGVASLDEYVDVKLIDAPPPAELLERLKRATSAGLEFLDAVMLGPDDPPVSAIVTAARYVVGIPLIRLAEIGGRSGITARIAEIMAGSEARVRRDLNGVGKIVNVRQYLQELSLGDEAADAELERAGIVGQMLPLCATIGISQTGSAKIAEVVEIVAGRPFEHLAVRVALVAGSGTPLELEPHRRVRPVPVVRAAVSDLPEVSELLDLPEIRAFTSAE